MYLNGVELVNARPEVVWVSSKCDFQQRQKAIHPGQQALRTEGERFIVTVTASIVRGALRKGSSGSYVLAAVFLEGMPSNTMTRSAK